jgi:integrase
LGKYLEEVKNTRSKPTYETYKFLLSPFDEYLQKNGKSIDAFENVDLVQYLKDRHDLGKYTRRQILLKVKTYIRKSLNEINYGATTDEMRVALNRQATLNRILDVRMLSFLKGSDGEEKKKSLTVEELKQLLDYANKEDKIHIYLLAYFGLRISEYLNITDVDYRVKKITFKSAKTYKLRSLYFTDYVGILLKKSEGRSFSAKELNHRLYKYDCMGFRVHPHMFRHTFITQMRKSLYGKVRDPKYVLKVLCGHSVRGDMTDLYTDPEDFNKECKQAMTEFHYMTGEGWYIGK